MKTLLTLMSFLISISACSASTTVLRYAVRSTLQGDTEMSIELSDGTFEIRKEIKKPKCNDLWDKKCFDEKIYKGKVSTKLVKKIVDKITKAELFVSKIDAFPKPGEEQYSIGLLEEGKKPQYANCTQSKLDAYPKYKSIQKELQKIVDSELKKK